MRRILLIIIYLSFAIACILASTHALAEIPDTVLNQKDTVVTINVHDEDGNLIYGLKSAL